MPRNPVLGGVARGSNRGLSSVACLAFVLAIALAFWTGAAWLGRVILAMSSTSLQG